ncbi:hypothetical protein JN11_04792 [Mucilaginibacter frigoritolerans]|uniref:Uncharacterized protein n=1 Tax=Mucilaginibacter frigoritolerans TaxID=652788 RepID=A0A562TMA0_9SPHI|nr:hypothetical protein JN11_04792 [Mucilaginibacter frigoritolerans]
MSLAEGTHPDDPPKGGRRPSLPRAEKRVVEEFFSPSLRLVVEREVERSDDRVSPLRAIDPTPYFTGSCKINSVPSPGWLFIFIDPPRASICVFTINSPMPLPSTVVSKRL